MPLLDPTSKELDSQLCRADDSVLPDLISSQFLREGIEQTHKRIM